MSTSESRSTFEGLYESQYQSMVRLAQLPLIHRGLRQLKTEMAR